MPGAMIRAMLAAYRRTLEKTMAQARSMQQVVDEAGLDWLETPDQAVVWGTALGLQDEIEGVLERSLEDVREGTDRRYGRLLPGLVPGLERGPADGRGGDRQRRRALLELGRSGPRRDDVGARDDRQLAVVVGERRRVLGRLVRRRWRRSRAAGSRSGSRCPGRDCQATPASRERLDGALGARQ